MLYLVMFALARCAFASPVVAAEVSVPTADRTPCIGNGYCVGSYITGASCVDGFCQCSSHENYHQHTCLPVVGSCEIWRSSSTALAEAFQDLVPRETYSCVADDNGQYEVHVLGVYEGVGPTGMFDFGHDPTHTFAPEMDVFVSAGQVSKPLVLVLSSYEPVNWVLHLPEDVEVQEVLLVAYHLEQSDVTVRSGSVNNVQRHSGQTGGAPACAYGTDTGGCNTVGMLTFVRGLFGPVSSFTGTYKANRWGLNIGTPEDDLGNVVVSG
ncbi:PREDICTED: uncharacterized protein LOC109487734 [Branchiostoma belcheri]|uniref:Uncharacterized protein LOC109487734 n=1 Tax=Branchiostoma belcheri TaxID=7741 RepID=A0A6P5AWA9_BRABE|nr:PREDICTED: uncharacterized protein LOC109487734 [Branchiostoma belcheri]